MCLLILAKLVMFLKRFLLARSMFQLVLFDIYLKDVFCFFCNYRLLGCADGVNPDYPVRIFNCEDL